MASVRGTQEEDLVYLGKRLRDAECRELEAHNATPDEAPRLGFELSRPCLTVEHEGRPIAMFGTTPSPVVESLGYVWLLGSDEIADISMQFLRESRQWLSAIGEGYEVLCNSVHTDNTLHHKWLLFLGFRFLNHKPPFIEFARTSPCVTQS